MFSILLVSIISMAHSIVFFFFFLLEDTTVQNVGVSKILKREKIVLLFSIALNISKATVKTFRLHFILQYVYLVYLRKILL